MRKSTMWFLNRFDSNRSVQSQKMASSLKFWFKKITRNCTIRVAKTNALISTAKLICAFVFAYADCWFSCDTAHLLAYVHQPI